MISALTRLADWSARTPKRLWAVAFLLFFTLAASWSVATPLSGSADEHAHYIRAAAVARGQFNGPEVMVPRRVAGAEVTSAETGAQLPEWYGELRTLHTCYSGHYDVPASCSPKLGSSEKTVQVTTAAGRYHPGYYLAVGWPSLLVKGPNGLYLMRLAAALFCSALLASAVVTAAEWRRRSLAVLGVFTAATPMTLFMAGMVNPSGGEIAAGILVWTALLSLVMSPDPKLANRRLARLGVGAVVLVSIRPLGLIWFAGALVFGLLLAQRSALLPLLRRKALWIWTGLLGAATAVALLWSSAHPDHPVLNSTHTPGDAAKLTLGYTNLYVQHMIGTFGWLDPPAPAFTFLVWLGVIAAVVVLGISFGRTRETVALIGMLVAIVMVPVAAQASQVEKVGMVWQGRYLMPFAVGLPLMAVLICAGRAPERGFPWRRLAGYCAGALALANAAAFFWTLRRFAVGTYGPWLPTPAHWAPPGGWALWTGVYTGAAIALALPSLMRDRAPAEPEPVARAADSGADSANLARPTPVL